MNKISTLFSLFLKKTKLLLPNGLALVLVFLLVRGYEVIMAYAGHSLPSGSAYWFAQGFFIDLTFASLVTVILLAFLALIALASERAAQYSFNVLSVLLLTSYVGVSEYFAYTLLPAGLDIFGYTSTELTDTIATSIQPSIGVIGPFLFFIGIYLVATWQFVKRNIGQKYALQTIGALFVLGCAFGFINPSESNYRRDVRYNITANKADILLSSTITQLYDSFTFQQKWTGREYPLLEKSHYKDVLSPFFKKSSQKPNLVFLIVEGLGRAFAGPGAQYGGFTPYLDSLAQQGLWFKNVLSGSGRSFGLHPTLFGSLPFGQKGFMELGADMPQHRTLISLLNNNGYQTNYFCGYDSHFDMIDVFLERQHIDHIMDESDFDSNYTKMDSIKGGFTWGYGDKSLFNESFKKIDRWGNQQPRMDVYFTLNTHEPFIIPQKEKYLKRFNQRLGQMKVSDQKKEVFKNYKDIFASLLFADDAIRNFINSYKKRPEYKNTIFIITGDHRMGPIPHQSKIDRFRVFFTIYSPLLKKKEQISSVSTHFNVTPTLLGYLKDNYHITLPPTDHWMAGLMDTTKAFRNIQKVPLMRNKNQIVDYLDHNYFLANKQLFKVEPKLWITPVQDGAKKTELEGELQHFLAMDHYITTRDKLIPTSQKTSLYKAGEKLVHKMKWDSLNDVKLFRKARRLAIEGKRDTARAIAHYVLGNNPNYHDMRTLVGRSYAWDQQYDKAREIFDDIIKRDSTYVDAYNALADVEIWSKHFDKALSVINNGLGIAPRQPSLLKKKATALERSGHPKQAQKIRQQLSKKYSEPQ